MPFKNPEKKKTYDYEYYNKNKKRILAQEKEYRKNDSEQIKERERKNSQKYHQTIKGKETLKKASTKWRKNNPDKVKEINKKSSRKYRQTKKGKENARKRNQKYSKSEKGKRNIKERYIKYLKTEKGRKARKRADIKKHHKRRGLGFIELNKSFPNSHAHHIDINHILYIPAELHKSIYHNIWTKKGMIEINRKAFEWLVMQENIEL